MDVFTTNKPPPKNSDTVSNTANICGQNIDFNCVFQIPFLKQTIFFFCQSVQIEEPFPLCLVQLCLLQYNQYSDSQMGT